MIATASRFRMLFLVLLCWPLAIFAAHGPDKPGPKSSKDDVVTISTAQGIIRVILFDDTPLHKANFLEKAKTGFYDGTTFHRVIPGFMIQGGDPAGNGMGGTDSIVDEFHPALSYNKPGLFGMANAGPRTGSSQFFITEVPTQNLDGKHTIFGEVVEGFELVPSLARVPRGMNDKPNDPIVMTKVTITRYPLGQPIWPAAPVPAKKTPGAGAVKTPVKTAPAVPKKTP